MTVAHSEVLRAYGNGELTDNQEAGSSPKAVRGLSQLVAVAGFLPKLTANYRVISKHQLCSDNLLLHFLSSAYVLAPSEKYRDLSPFQTPDALEKPVIESMSDLLESDSGLHAQEKSTCSGDVYMIRTTAVRNRGECNREPSTDEKRTGRPLRITTRFEGVNPAPNRNENDDLHMQSTDLQKPTADCSQDPSAKTS
ncbi:hypothetical protein E5288_WYG018531 [Bos mutus]|uniref:Uncharacterized protein n=1 Tax=Bos mutus TaxID=72004 RepID=A0A6B0RZR5_9CETA|nr:hypothetical protein [Bos mutus]